MPTTAHADRQDLLAQISNFLLDHQLDVNPGNLTLAQQLYSGTNVRLGQQLAERELADQPVTQAWLDDFAGNGGQTGEKHAKRLGHDDPVSLIDKIDQLLQDFRRQASEAGTTAAQYHAELSETIAGLAAARPAAEIAPLTQLTHPLIERTRAVAAEMRRHETAAGALRESLELARSDVAVEHPAGLDSYREFELALERECCAARAATASLSIACCNIDRFKVLNDTHGRDTGDRVIQAIARVLQRLSGQSCYVAHQDGQAFVLLFRGMTPGEAGRELDQARENFAQRKLVDRQTRIAIGSVTFSGGVVDGLAYGDPRAALEAAHEALGEAKQQGRNRIVIAADPAQATLTPAASG